MQNKSNINIQISLLLIAILGIMSGMTIVASLPLMSQTFSEIPNHFILVYFLGQFSSPLLFEPIVSNYAIQILFFIVSILSILVASILFIKTRIKKATLNT